MKKCPRLDFRRIAALRLLMQMAQANNIPDATRAQHAAMITCIAAEIEKKINWSFV
jgi:hypothetical protein